MSYAAKFASCLYGPFRNATGVGSTFGDRKQYQLPPNSTSLAMNAVQRDVAEGADFIIVKPATLYLDIMKLAKQYCESHGNIPVVAYHVSGEYASMCYSIEAGVYCEKDILME
uniref:Delta-aminolevulinic acid dehydratase n=1 Tax=Lygus hesperus TaxID=30085 RepID=A0A146M8J9_LYGHE